MGERVKYYDLGFDKAFNDILIETQKRCGRIMNPEPLVLELRGSVCRLDQPSVVKLDETPEQIVLIEEGGMLKRFA